MQVLVRYLSVPAGRSGKPEIAVLVNFNGPDADSRNIVALFELQADTCFYFQLLPPDEANSKVKQYDFFLLDFEPYR